MAASVIRDEEEGAARDVDKEVDPVLGSLDVVPRIEDEDCDVLEEENEEHDDSAIVVQLSILEEDMQSDDDGVDPVAGCNDEEVDAMALPFVLDNVAPVGKDELVVL